MKAPQDGTPPNPMPCMPRLYDRLPDDDTAGKPTDGLLVRLAIAIPQEDEIPEQHLPVAFRHGYLEPPHAVFRMGRVHVRMRTDLEDDFGEETFDVVFEADKGFLGGSQGSVTALVERVGDEIVKDGAHLFGDASRFGEDVVEHVVNVHAMIVQRVFARVSEMRSGFRKHGTRTEGETDVRVREPEAPKELRDVRLNIGGGVDHDLQVVLLCVVMPQQVGCDWCPGPGGH